MKKNSVSINFLYNSFYQLIAILIPVVTMPFLTRVLGAEGVGSFSYTYSIAYYFSMFIKLGLNSYGNRTIASVTEGRKKLSHTFWSIYLFQLFLGIIFTGLYIVYCIIWSEYQIYSYILILLVISSVIDITWFFQGVEEFKIIVPRDSIIKILSTISIFVFVRNSNDIGIYILIRGCEFFLSQLITWNYLGKYVDFVEVQQRDIIKHIKPNLILFVPTIAVSIYKIMDKIMLGILTNSSEVGYYHSAENIIQVPMALVTALGTVMLPRVSNMLAFKVEKDCLEDTFQKSIKIIMFLVSLLCFGIMSVSKQFVPIFYGDGFEKCIELYNILLPSCLFLAFANVIRTQFLIPNKWDRVFILSLFGGAGINFAINMLLIPHLQSVGAAIGTLLAEITVCLIQTFAVWKVLPIKKSIINSLPFIFAGILMVIAFGNYEVMMNKTLLGLFIKVGICGGFYFALMGGFYTVGHVCNTLRRRKK